MLFSADKVADKKLEKPRPCINPKNSTMTYIILPGVLNLKTKCRTEVMKIVSGIRNSMTSEEKLIHFKVAKASVME